MTYKEKIVDTINRQRLGPVQAVYGPCGLGDDDSDITYPGAAAMGSSRLFSSVVAVRLFQRLISRETQDIS